MGRKIIGIALILLTLFLISLCASIMAYYDIQTITGIPGIWGMVLDCLSFFGIVGVMAIPLVISTKFLCD